jgi:hypothetical protein
MAMQNANKPVVTESAPVDWSGEQEIIAKDALAVLVRQFPGIRWGVEWTESVGNALGMLVVRMLDIPTKVVYTVHPRDIDRDRMRCIIRAGGELLEAHGLSTARYKKDRGFRGLKQTAAGLIVPDYAAVPEGNMGYEAIKKEYERLNRKNATVTPTQDNGKYEWTQEDYEKAGSMDHSAQL